MEQKMMDDVPRGAKCIADSHKPWEGRAPGLHERKWKKWTDLHQSVSGDLGLKVRCFQGGSSWVVTVTDMQHRPLCCVQCHKCCLGHREVGM